MFSVKSYSGNMEKGFLVRDHTGAPKTPILRRELLINMEAILLKPGSRNGALRTVGSWDRPRAVSGSVVLPPVAGQARVPGDVLRRPSWLRVPWRVAR